VCPVAIQYIIRPSARSSCCWVRAAAYIGSWDRDNISGASVLSCPVDHSSLPARSAICSRPFALRRQSRTRVGDNWRESTGVFCNCSIRDTYDMMSSDSVKRRWGTLCTYHGITVFVAVGQTGRC